MRHFFLSILLVVGAGFLFVPAVSLAMPSCTFTTDCPDGQTCADNVCTCTANEQCSYAGTFCKNGECIAGCASDADCGTGQVCGSDATCTTPVCVCQGNLLWTTAGKVVVAGLNSDQVAAATSLCVSYGGSYSSTGCANVKDAPPGIAEADCAGLSDPTNQDALLKAYGLPSPQMSLEAFERVAELSVTCAMGAAPARVVVPETPATTGGSGSTNGAGKNPGIISLTNPLGNITTATQLIGTIINGVLGIIGALAFGMLVYGGFIWMTSNGSEEKIEVGTHSMLYAVLGLFLVFSAYIIVTTFLTYVITGQAASTFTGPPAPVAAPATTPASP